MKEKVFIVGAGYVGAETANYLAMRDFCDIVMIDILEGVPQGKSLDMSHANPIRYASPNIRGQNNYDGIEEAKVIVITAGVPRKPGMTREELLDVNFNIIKSVTEEIKKRNKNAILIVVTNPLDAMTYAAYKISGFERERVIGMAGVLDSTRFRAFIAMELGVAYEDVSAITLGTHGDLMVPLPKYATVGGIPVTHLIPKDKLDSIVERTRKAGTEIVSLLKTGSAYYGPGAATAIMVESIIKDKKRVVSASVLLKGEYGINDIFVGVPIVLGEKGVEKIIEMKLEPEELEALKKSAEHVKKMQEEIDAKLK
ncbi:MAG: malate dehydrogenase [Candidatus Hydrothermales bacterium]